jgi:hypothetical protein
MQGFSVHEDNFHPFCMSGVPVAADFFQSLHPLLPPENEVWHCLYGFDFPHEKFSAFLHSIPWVAPAKVHLLFIEDAARHFFDLDDYLKSVVGNSIEAIDWKNLAEQHVRKSTTMEGRALNALSIVDAWQDAEPEDRVNTAEDILRAVGEVLRGNKP